MQRPPIIVLGGSDARPCELPEAGRDKHPLAGYKAMRIRLGGRPLIDAIVDRLRQSDCFSSIYIAGPVAVYGERRQDARVIETEGSFGHNIRVALEEVRGLHDGPIAFTTCDILPDVEELRRLMAEYHEVSPCHMWYVLSRVPRDRSRLGASAWKPVYRVIESPGGPPTEILPGHLIIVDPAALRLEFVYRLFQIGYSTRNRPIAFRRAAMLRGVIGALLYQDFLHLFGLRWPSLTWNVLRAGIPTGRRLRDGRVTVDELEQAVCRVFVTSRWRRRYPERRTRLTVDDGLSLALDIDTEEEAVAAGGDVAKSTRRQVGSVERT